MNRGSKKIIFYLILLTGLASAFYYYDIGGAHSYLDSWLLKVSVIDDVFLNNKSIALREAKNRFQTELVKGNPFDGRCLVEELVSGWSLDIVHVPRLEEDDQQENQCRKFLTGETSYLIEYSTTGNFVSIQKGVSP